MRGLILGITLLCGCGKATLVARHDPSAPNAPANLKRGGVVRYDDGERGQAKAYELMHQTCGGAYRIVKSGRVSLGRETYMDALGASSDEQVVTEAEFECE